MNRFCILDECKVNIINLLLLLNIMQKCISIKFKLIFITLLVFQSGFSQQYDTVLIEDQNIDENNKIYKTGSVFVYDYEIIHDGQLSKLKSNSGMFASTEFELVPIETDSIDVDKIHLLVQPVKDEDRTNDNQTQICYLQEPVYASFNSTGVVENENNVWIHPIRKGFFNSLETAPFPFVKKPLKVGAQWTDQMKIGQGWGNKIWGQWEGSLIQTYDYTVVGKEILETKIGKIDCFIIQSTSKSSIGETKLKSFFSAVYGFVRLEYALLNDLEVNMWLIETKSEVEFNDLQVFFKTKQYIKN